MRAYIEKHLVNDFIRFFQSFVDASILFVKKKNDNLRLCVNYRELNVLTIKNKYSLSLIDESLNRLNRIVKYISVRLQTSEMFSFQLIVRLISKKLEILATICWLCTTVRIKRIKNFNVQVTRLIACCCSKRCKQHFFEFDVCSACDHVEYLILSKFDSHFLLIWTLSVLHALSS